MTARSPNIKCWQHPSRCLWATSSQPHWQAWSRAASWIKWSAYSRLWIPSTLGYFVNWCENNYFQFLLLRSCIGETSVKPQFRSLSLKVPLNLTAEAQLQDCKMKEPSKANGIIRTIVLFGPNQVFDQPITVLRVLLNHRSESTSITRALSKSQRIRDWDS
jgi:hypothetical protein